jgi:hypothetical protein
MGLSRAAAPWSGYPGAVDSGHVVASASDDPPPAGLLLRQGVRFLRAGQHSLVIAWIDHQNMLQPFHRCAPSAAR